MSITCLPSYSQLNVTTNPPEYSPRAQHDPWVALSPEARAIVPGGNASDQADLYTYHTKHLTLNLGPRLWGTSLPVYGRGSTIQGFIDVVDKKGPQKLTLTFEGYSYASVKEQEPGGLSVAIPPLKIVNDSITLSSPASAPAPTSSSTGVRVPFTLPVRLSQAYPTANFIKEGLTAEVAYRLRVELRRKGWFKREELIVPIAYLPRTSPPRFTHRVPPLPESFDWKCRNKADSLEYQTFPIQRKSPTSPLDTLPKLDIQLHLPHPLAYAAQEVIYFSITISTPSLALSPPLSSGHLTDGPCQRMWIDEGRVIENMTVELLKIVTLVLPSGREVRREVLLARGTGNCRSTDVFSNRTSDQMTTIYGEVSGGTASGEASWAVIYGPKVMYEVRTTLVIPGPSSKCSDAVYSCSVPIELKTDFTEDLLNNEFAVQEPALGFLNSN